MSLHGHTLLLVFACWSTALGAGEDVWSPNVSMRINTIDTVVPSPDGKWVAFSSGRHSGNHVSFGRGESRNDHY